LGYVGINWTPVLNSCVRGGRDGLAATDIGSVASTADGAFPVRTARAPGRKIQKKLFSHANVACHAHILGLLKLFEFGEKGVWPKECWKCCDGIRIGKFWFERRGKRPLASIKRAHPKKQTPGQ